MRDEGKTKAQLIDELGELRRRIARVEKATGKLKRMSDEFHESETYFKAIVDSVKAGVMVIDAERHKIVDINTAAAEMIGVPKRDAIGKECHRYVCPAERGKCPITDLRQTIDNSERYLINARGRKIPIIKTVVPLVFKNRRYLLETFIDISERKRLDDKLKRLATTDVLTGAYNRIGFDEIIEREMESAKRYRKPLSVILFDIDHFKRVNDTFGHHTGDAVLRQLAKIVRNTVRKVDYFIRWGGEEFLIVSEETDGGQARIMAERLRKRVEEHVFGEAGRITISCGVAEFGGEDTENTLLKRADDALYRAKRQGRNRVVYVTESREGDTRKYA